MTSIVRLLLVLRHSQHSRTASELAPCTADTYGAQAATDRYSLGGTRVWDFEMEEEIFESLAFLEVHQCLLSTHLHGRVRSTSLSR